MSGSPVYQRKLSEPYVAKWEKPTWAKAASMVEPKKGPQYSCHRDQDPLDNIIGCTSNPNVQENCQAKRLSEGKTCPKPCELEHGKPDPCLDKVHHFVVGRNHTIKYQDHRDHDIMCDEIIGQTPLPSNHFTTPHTHGGHSVNLPSNSSSDAPKINDQQTRKTVEERKEFTVEHSGPKKEHTTMASRPTECKDNDKKAWESCLKHIKEEGDVSHLVHGFEDNAPAQGTKVTTEFRQTVDAKSAPGKKELPTKASFPTECKENDKKAWESCLKHIKEEGDVSHLVHGFEDNAPAPATKVTTEFKQTVDAKSAPGKKELPTKASFPTENKANDTKAWENCMKEVKADGKEDHLVSDFLNSGSIGARREEGVHKTESSLAAKGELRKEFAEGKLK